MPPVFVTILECTLQKLVAINAIEKPFVGPDLFSKLRVKFSNATKKVILAKYYNHSSSLLIFYFIRSAIYYYFHLQLLYFFNSFRKIIFPHLMATYFSALLYFFNSFRQSIFRHLMATYFSALLSFIQLLPPIYLPPFNGYVFFRFTFYSITYANLSSAI